MKRTVAVASAFVAGAFCASSAPVAAMHYDPVNPDDVFTAHFLEEYPDQSNNINDALTVAHFVCDALSDKPYRLDHLIIPKGGNRNLYATVETLAVMDICPVNRDSLIQVVLDEISQ